jgi:hypothetical protein
LKSNYSLGSAAPPCAKEESVHRQAIVRNQRGEMITEFASALTILIVCFFIPLLNLTAIPVRYLIGMGMMSDLTHKLSLAETRGQAVSLASNLTSYQQLANKFGISIGECDLSMICKNKASETIILPGKKPVPAAWLPGGTKGPCIYLLQTETELAISPLMCGGPRVPGLTAPLKLTFVSNSPWENLSCDPATRAFYVNE